MRNKTYHRKKALVLFGAALVLLVGLLGRLFYLMVFRADYYQEKAKNLHEREREIKAARGKILDRNGKVLADNRSVCTISVIHSQITDKETVIRVLGKELEMDLAEVRKRVEKVSSMERIRTNVEKEVGDRIREYHLAGVKVDEDYKRFYPYGNLASKVLGFTGGDNQGIIGLEVRYESYLKGTNGRILTVTDARGMELDGVAEGRVEPVAGHTVKLSLDANIQRYAQQEAEAVMEKKEAEGVSLLVMNPQNGEIYAMVDVPEFDLNHPYSLDSLGVEEKDAKKQQELLNQMWRNGCISDTYEPGSTFKIITSSACLEEGVVTEADRFVCPGYRVVEDRRIRCHKVGGHGSETFVEGVKNSCNPVFIDIGLRLGAERFYDYFQQFGLREKTGIDLPGEAGTITHKLENVGPVELATMTFGQSFQLSPIRMATTVSALINGGRKVTPHLATAVYGEDGQVLQKFQGEQGERVVSKKTSSRMGQILEQVVSEGSGNKAFIEGYRIGGKTATSQTLPRSANRYIASFIGFAPAEDPQVLAMVIIHNPKGIYYGGTIAAPVIRTLFENILPYLGIEKTGESLYTE